MKLKNRFFLTVCTVICMSLTIFAQSLSAKTIKATGVVKDANGEPIIGALVAQKGNTSHATATDLDGKFVLDMPENSSIEFSCIGYVSQTQKVGATDKTCGEDVRMLTQNCR